MLQTLDHIADETLGVHIANLGRPIVPDHGIANRVHEMGLAKANTAVDKKRVIGLAGVLGDLACSGPRELVAFTFDEELKGKLRVKPRYDRRMTTRLDRHRLRPSACARRRSRSRPRSDLNNDFGIGATVINKL